MAQRQLKRIGCVLLVGGTLNCGGTVEQQRGDGSVGIVGLPDNTSGYSFGGNTGVAPGGFGGAIGLGGHAYGGVGAGGYVGTQPGIPDYAGEGQVGGGAGPAGGWGPGGEGGAGGAPELVGIGGEGTEPQGGAGDYGGGGSVD
jgi:hypothetical protein